MMPLQEEHRLRQAMTRAVRLASRGHGGAEPNPMVGCVLLDAELRTIADGYHAKCGGAHAEIEALRAAGARAQGSTAVVTLEPCNHHGRTGPCAEALINAGVRRVYFAVRDPSPLAAGGAQRLRDAGIEVHQLRSTEAEELVLPFVKCMTQQLPWITVKWAASIDGRIALSSRDSKWISGERARHMVHRERGRVDAVMTGIGTILADDPRLNARGVALKRRAMRVIYDPLANTPPHAAVLERADEGKTVLLVLPQDVRDEATSARIRTLVEKGASLVDIGTRGEITPAMRTLFTMGVSTVLIEAGGGLVGKLFAEGLVDELFTFVGPLVIGDASAVSSVRGLRPDSMTDAVHARLIAVRRRDGDALLHYRFTSFASLGLQ